MSTAGPALKKPPASSAYVLKSLLWSPTPYVRIPATKLEKPCGEEAPWEGAALGQYGEGGATFGFLASDKPNSSLRLATTT
jgi:hypothetical protein